VLSERRRQIAADIVARTGIDEVMIERLVRRFYGAIRRDEFVGPVFEERVADWEPHLRRMCEFWSSVTLMSGRYHGRPMEKHLRLPVDSRHFGRWLELFEKAAHEVCPPAAAAYFIERAHWIAQSLELGVLREAGSAPGDATALERR
jgi:hemoglobin